MILGCPSKKSCGLYIERKPLMHIFELTQRLIEIESVTGNEQPIALFLREYLSSLGYQADLQEAAANRFNVQAFAGKPDLVFTTHLDTVPPYIPFREDDEFIYGRGACDAKGIIAAMVEAAQTLRATGENRLGLLFVVGEERNSAGALCANKTPPGSRFYIDGEPTENKLALGSKGSLRADIVAHGKAAHSAYPLMGESAILKLLDILTDIRRMQFSPDPVLGETTCNIGILEAGSKVNVIPDRARAEIMFRTVEPVEDLKRRLESLITGRADLSYPFEVPILLLEPVEGFETTVVAFGSDVPFLDNWGKPYLMGPGSILDAHTDHEKVSKRQLLEGVDKYVRLAQKLLAT
jgi:acetylornithine deacetylase